MQQGMQQGMQHRKAPPYVRRWMKEHGQAGKEVAAAIGLSKAQLYRRLRGEYPFTLMQARAIARYLRVPYEEVFPNDEGVDPAELIARRVAEQATTLRYAR